MRTILSNPLFRVVPSGMTYHPQPAPESLDSLDKRIAKDPMAVFDQLVAAGSVDLKNLEACLVTQLALIGSHSSDIKQEMQKTGAGSRIINWFWASDPFSRRLLFKSQRTLRAAVKFMVAEGLHNEIAVLLKMVKDRYMGGDKCFIPKHAYGSVFKHFLQDYIEADVRYGRGISGALTTLIHAADLTATSVPDETRVMMLKKGTSYLVGLIVSHRRKILLSSVPSSDYDRFCEVLDTLPVPRLGSETLRLYHPTQPTAQPFLNYIRDHPDLEIFSGNETAQEQGLQAHLDAMRLLLDQEKYKDAVWLVPRIKKLFSEEDGVEAQKSHDSRLQMDKLLGRLDVALA